MRYALGLDLGPSSIGWACVNEQEQKILGMGSRVFPEGVARDTKGKELSKNATRREARQSRRQYDRKRQRRNQLKQILLNNEMFPKPSGENEFFGLDVYQLRKKGLEEKLSKLEFGRVLYHLNQRRGFKSSRKSGASNDDGKVAEETAELQKKIDNAGCRTLGEYLSGLNPMEQRIRGPYTLRSMFEKEFDLLWETQSRFHSELNEELKKKIRDYTLFYQRPLKSVAHLIGLCSLEPGKRRCSKAALDAQLFRILEQVNRLTMIDDDGVVHEFCRKTDEDFDTELNEKRNLLIQLLKESEKLTFDQIRKKLDLTETTSFNLEKGGSKHLIGNRTGKKLSGIFKDWFKLSNEEQEKRHQTIQFAQDPEWLTGLAQTKWGLPEDKAEKLAYKTHLEPGYMHYSRKVLRKLIPLLEAGLNLADALAEAGYSREREYKNAIERIKNLRNPIVAQTLYELLRLLKVIRQTYGEPEKVRVELARELKSSAKKREDIHFENLKRKNEHEEIDKILDEEGIKPTGDARIRYKLWKECKETCPYTGDKINFHDLFSESPSFQIEHIIPYPRSLDDSYMNKTLCRVDENVRKGNKTPYEFYGGTSEFDKILTRVKTLELPYNKIKKFRQKELDEDFANRQLTDTTYISREARELLKSQGLNALVSKGQATATLRYLWGLNSLISPDAKKNREDHRHHAIDAAVVAVTVAHTLHKLSAYNKYDRTATREKFEEPWEGFRSSLKPHVERMLVSYRVNKRARGALHEETLYGTTNLKDEKNVPLYAVRKNLDALTPAMVGKIADPTVKGIVKNRLRELGVDPDKKKFNIPKEAFKDLFMKSRKGLRIPIKKVRIHEPKNNAFVLGKRHRTAVEPGNNHHVVLYRYRDEKGREKQGGKICTLFEAVRRTKKGEPIIRRDLGPDKEFLMSLAINETVLLDMAEDQVDWQNPDYDEINQKLFKVQIISNQITFRHHLAATLNNNDMRVIKWPNTFSGIKVRIDRIGRIFKAHD